MSIDGIGGKGPGIGTIRQLREQMKPQDGQSGTAEKGSGFQQALNEALQEINRLSGNADAEVENLVSGRSQSPHGAMIALEKADVAFQLMNAVRTKIVRAYEEVMRTQV
jgi:flagellar hook-basal body complex protein FliE